MRLAGGHPGEVGRGRQTGGSGQNPGRGHLQPPQRLLISAVLLTPGAATSVRKPAGQGDSRWPPFLSTRMPAHSLISGGRSSPALGPQLPAEPPGASS